MGKYLCPLCKLTSIDGKCGCTKDRSAVKQLHGLYVYQRIRAAYLLDHVFCEICRDRLAVEIHHQIPLAEVPILENLIDTSHWQAVCRECHKDQNN